MNCVSVPGLVARKAALLASVSMMALVVALSDLRAQQQSGAPPGGAPPGTGSSWSEAGLTGQPATDPAIGLPPFGPFADLGPGVGWTAAVGFDYHPAQSPYLFSGQFRYDRNNGTSAPTSSPITGTATLNKGTHWLVDVAVGLGFGNAQINLGSRVAELASTANASGFGAIECVTPTTCTTGNISFQSRSQFLGVGPQLSIKGSAPLGGSWAFDYFGGVAALVGSRSLNATQAFYPTLSGFPSPVTTLCACSTAVVPNLEVQAGISYWLTPDFKLTVSYRFDGYWNALRVIESNGGLGQQNQFYYGPVLRGTITF
jgi:hypothetical protein